MSFFKRDKNQSQAPPAQGDAADSLVTTSKPTDDDGRR